MRGKNIFGVLLMRGKMRQIIFSVLAMRLFGLMFKHCATGTSRSVFDFFFHQVLSFRVHLTPFQGDTSWSPTKNITHYIGWHTVVWNFWDLTKTPPLPLKCLTRVTKKIKGFLASLLIKVVRKKISFSMNLIIRNKL